MGTKGNQGIRSKNLVHPSVRTGSGSHSTRPAGVNMLGAMQGNKATSQKGTTGYTGEKLHGGKSFQPVKFGNEIALNSKSAPGQGRRIYASGSQACQGQPAQGSPRPNAQRDALEQE
jgi:hypothetical protein